MSKPIDDIGPMPKLTREDVIALFDRDELPLLSKHKNMFNQTVEVRGNKRMIMASTLPSKESRIKSLFMKSGK